jgi:hypothetical protein
MAESHVQYNSITMATVDANFSTLTKLTQVEHASLASRGMPSKMACGRPISFHIYSFLKSDGFLLHYQIWYRT